MEIIYNQILEYEILVILLGAFILDLLIGDPEYKLHPIRLIGNLIFRSEKIFRKISNNQKFNGLLFWIFITSVTFFVSKILCQIHFFVEVFITYSCLSIKDLKDKAFEIRSLIKNEKIAEARKSLSMIVGRETDKLDKKEIIRAVVETVAENIVDGIISPLFYYLLGGAPLMILYKAVNTMDSMVGYKNDKYIDFGFFAAKLDDLFNYLPARINFLILNLSGLLSGKNVRNGVKIGLRDGRKNPSPNSGISEAIVAGLCGVQLGGANFYHGKKVEKPVIGNKIFELENKNIKDVVILAYVSSIITTAIILIVLHESGAYVF